MVEKGKLALSRWASTFFWVSIFIFCAVLLSKFHIEPELSPDSWSYFELSKTIYSNFYNFSTLRSYENASQYSASFPPLFPFLISTFNVLFDLGPRAGLVINIAILPLIAISLERLSFRVFRLRFLGCVTFLVCLSDTSFLNEVLSGRAIPLQILILVILFRSLLDLSSETELNGFIRSSMLLGFCLLNRFDAVATVPIIFVYILSLKPTAKQIFTFTVSFLLSISPWIIYSIGHFGSVWKTDNSFVAKAVAKTYVTDWYSRPILTIREDFWGWYERVLSNVYPLYFNYMEGLEYLGRSFVTALTIFLMFLFVSFLRGERAHFFIKMDSLNALTKFVLLLLGFGIVTLVPNLLTGYFDIRYFAFQRMLLVAMSLGTFYKILSLKLDVNKALGQSVFLCAPCLLALSYIKLPPAPPAPSASESDALFPAWVSELEGCILKQESFTGVFFLDTYNPFQFGAITSLKTGHSPENFKDLSTNERRLFFKSFRFSHILSDRDKATIESELGFTLEHAECQSNLYKITS